MDLDDSRATGPHALLRRLVGRWEGTASLWFDPSGPPADEQPVTGEIVPVHGDRYLEHRYTTTLFGETHSGTALVGCHLDRSLWRVAWVDSFHTGTDVMFSEGPWVAGAGAVDVLGSYDCEGGPAGWRTTLTPTGDGLDVRHLNVPPGEGEQLAVVFAYRPA
jgi:hypothetical protein